MYSIDSWWAYKATTWTPLRKLSATVEIKGARYMNWIDSYFVGQAVFLLLPPVTIEWMKLTYVTTELKRCRWEKWLIYADEPMTDGLSPIFVAPFWKSSAMRGEATETPLVVCLTLGHFLWSIERQENTLSPRHSRNSFISEAKSPGI